MKTIVADCPQQPGVGSVADTSIEVSLDALMTLGEGCYGVTKCRREFVSGLS